MHEKYVFVGRGPAATGQGDGWTMRADLYAYCRRCGSWLSLDPDITEECSCGRLFKDADAGRFGHVDGDEAVEIYRLAAPGEGR